MKQLDIKDYPTQISYKKRRTFTPKEINYLSKLYNKLDKNNSGGIESSEFIESFKEMGVKMKEEEIKELLEKIDHDKNGVVTFKEFINLMCNIPNEILLRNENLKQIAIKEEESEKQLKNKNINLLSEIDNLNLLPNRNSSQIQANTMLIEEDEQEEKQKKNVLRAKKKRKNESNDDEINNTNEKTQKQDNINFSTFDYQNCGVDYSSNTNEDNGNITDNFNYEKIISYIQNNKLCAVLVVIFVFILILLILRK